MKWILNGLFLSALLLVSRVSLAAPVPCPDILLPGGVCPADAGAAVAACCDCNAFPNHGQYVRCVAHSANALRKAGCLDHDAQHSIKRCAARSTCGKPGFVTCCRQRPGECNDAGVCTKTDPPVMCTTSAECPPITKCSIKRDADTCILVGGTPGSAASCCDACP